MYKSTVVILIYIVSNAVDIESARILAVYPTPSISHQVIFQPLTNELVKRGHEVIVITTDPQYLKGEAPKNLTEIDIHDSYGIFQEEIFKATKGAKSNSKSQLMGALNVMRIIVQNLLLKTEVQDIIENKVKIDLLLLEAWVRPSLIFSHLIKAPVIQVSSLGSVYDNLEYIGASTHPFLYPSLLQQRTVNLTLLEKVYELYGYYSIISGYKELEAAENAMFRNMFGNDTPDVSELNKNVDMLFLNNYAIWDHNRPVPPNVVYIGGIRETPEKDLPEDLKTYLDSSENGVIYVSFGTNVDPSSIRPEKVEILVNVLSKVPYDVLWKWNTELPGNPKNVRVQKWFPQPDVLRHPKIKLFITQAGLQSTDEAISAGVPMVGIPVLCDQWYNAEQYKRLQIGDRVDLDTLSEEGLRSSIDKVLNDNSYRESIKHLKEIYDDQPQTPLDLAVWWIEYVIRNRGAKHLRSPAANMPWSEYFEVKLVLTLLFAAVFIFSVPLAVLYCLVKFLLGSVSIKVKTS